MTIVNKNKIIIVALAIVLAIASAALILFHTKTTLTLPSPVLGRGHGQHLATLMGSEFYNAAYKNAPATIPSDANTVGGIVNHHLLAAPLLAQFFDGLAGQKPKHLIIIGPDHLSRGKAPITVSAEGWGTAYGDLGPDTALIDRLSADGVAHIEEWPFDYEFSVGGLVTFAKRSLPGIDIATIIIRSDASNDAFTKLAAALPRSSDTLVVASIDFSHYLPSDAADFHDLTSRAVISDFDLANLDKIEIDSVPTLRTALEYFQLRNALTDTLVASTNSAKITGRLDTQETTSYLNQYFSVGDKTPFEVKTSLFLGAIKNIISPENRFMRGFMSIDDGSTLPVDLKKTNLSVGIARYGDKTVYYLFPVTKDKNGTRLMTATEENAYYGQKGIKESIITIQN